MADKKISQLNSAGALAGTEVLPIVQSGETKKLALNAITTVGTLGSLTVTGDVTVDTNTLKVNSTTDRVGIGTATPAYKLDVAGDTNLSTGSALRINGTSILSSTTLGSSVVNSSLTSVGTIGTGTWQGTPVTDTYLATISAAGKVANSATTATSANTASAIVARDASGNFTAGTITINGASLATGTPSAAAVGRFIWDDQDGTAHLRLKGGVVDLAIGQEQLVRVYNNTGSPLSVGQVVYVTGSSGQRLTVALANAASEATSTDTIGIVTETIGNNQQGFVRTSGLIKGLDTFAFTEGDQLYLSDSTPGTFTNVRPTQPSHGVRLGYCVKKNNSDGWIFLAVNNGYELDELHDVLITTPAAGQILRRNAGNTLWTNQTGPTGAIVGTSDIQTLTNKTIDGSLNTISNISNAATTATSANTVNTIVARDALGNFSAGTITATFTGNLTGNVNGNITGNASTVTNGVYTTGSYADPAWITSLAGSKITGVVSTAGDAGLLIGTVLASNVVTSSLTSVGTLTGGTWNATPITNSYIATGLDVTKLTVGATLPSNVVSSSLTSVGTLSSLTVSGNLTVDTNTLFVDSANNRVGVGTVTPSTALEISGNSATTGPSLRLANQSNTMDAGAVIGTMEFFSGDDSGGDAVVASIQAVQPLTTPVTGSLLFKSGNNTTGMVLDASGNVGIGTTSPAYKLDVSGGIRADYLERSSSGDVSVGHSGAFGVMLRTNGTDRWRVNSSGHFLAATDASFDIGASGANRPRDLYLSNDASGRQFLSTVGFLSSADTSVGFQIRNLGAGTGGIRFANYANNVEWMRLDASGNLGLGVTPSAWTGSGGTAVEVGALGNAIFGSTSITTYTFNANFDSTWKYSRNGFASRYMQQNGAHSWLTAPSGTAGGAITFTTSMLLDASGNLGLGVTPSASTLRLLQGSAGFTVGSQGNSMNVSSNAVWNSGYVYATTATATLYNQSSGAHIFYTAPSGTAGNAITFTQAMTLDASGNLDLGTTSTTTATAQRILGSTPSLSIGATPRATDGQSASTLILGSYGRTVGVNRQHLYRLQTLPQSDFGEASFVLSSSYDGGAYVERWRFNNNGHFLAGQDATYDIGASGANRPRDIYMSRDLRVGGGLTVTSGPTSLTEGAWLAFGANNTLFSDTTNGTILQAAPTADRIVFRSSNTTERMRITSAGNVGIGTTDADPFARNDERRLALVASGASDNSQLSISAGASAGRGAQIYLGQSSTRHFTLSANSTESSVGTTSSTPMRLLTGDVERVRVKTGGQVRFVPLAAAPTTNVEDGDVYYDSSTNKLRVRAGGAWVDLH